jgi:hypothetical protein
LFPLANVPGYEDYVSIHWRLGDYVQHSASFPPITLDYVDHALSKIHHETGLSKVMVFSDGMPFVKEEVKKSIWKNMQWEFSEGRGEKEDLSLGVSCGHHIIANSTYSWWMGYLGHNPNRVIVSPSGDRGCWYGMSSGIKKDCVDLLPDSWIKIKFR